MNAAFAQTRSSRRKLMRLLQQQQEVDSKAASRLKERFLAGHRKLLECIGEKLNEYGSSLHMEANQSFVCAVSEEDRQLFTEVCNDFSLDEWETLRVKEVQLGIRRAATDTATLPQSPDECAAQARPDTASEPLSTSVSRQSIHAAETRPDR